MCIRDSPKQPYRAPDGQSFFGQKGGYVEEVLSPESLKRNGIFDAHKVDALVRKFKRQLGTGTADNMALIGILSTEILLERFMHPHNVTKWCGPADFEVRAS